MAEEKKLVPKEQKFQEVAGQQKGDLKAHGIMNSNDMVFKATSSMKAEQGVAPLAVQAAPKAEQWNSGSAFLGKVEVKSDSKASQWPFKKKG